MEKRKNNKPAGERLMDGSGEGVRSNFNRGGCHDGETCDVISDAIRHNYKNRVVENASQ